MGAKRSLFEYMFDRMALEEEPTPVQSVVELLGDNRVLIENHKGVKQYSAEMIQIGVSFGCIAVFGCNLRLRLMTAEKLVIMGQIRKIEVLQGGVA